MGSIICDSAFQQAQLPVSLGGLGLRSAASHTSSAFLASSFAAEPLMEGLLHLDQLTIDRTAALTHFNGITGPEEHFVEEQLASEKQKSLSFKVDQVNLDTFCSSLVQPRDQARHHSLQVVHSGD